MATLNENVAKTKTTFRGIRDAINTHLFNNDGSISKDMPTEHYQNAIQTGAMIQYGKGLSKGISVNGTRTDWSNLDENGVLTDAIEALQYEDTAKGTTFLSMCKNDKNLKNFPEVNLIRAENLMSLLHGCSELTTIGDMDVSNVYDFRYMFSSCGKVTKFPRLDTKRGKYFSYMYHNCKGLTEMPELKTGKGIWFSYMFYGCENLTSNKSDYQKYDLSNAEKVENMFFGCKYNLTYLPEMNTSKCTSFKNMVAYCTKLRVIEGIDITNAEDLTGMFTGCSGLEEVTFLPNQEVKPIRQNLNLQWSNRLSPRCMNHIIFSLAHLVGEERFTKEISFHFDACRAMDNNSGWNRFSDGGVNYNWRDYIEHKGWLLI